MKPLFMVRANTVKKETLDKLEAEGYLIVQYGVECPTVLNPPPSPVTSRAPATVE